MNRRSMNPNHAKRGPFEPLRPTKQRFNLYEITVSLLKAAEIHEGYWQLQVMFGQHAVNMAINGQTVPAAITQFAGLQLARVKALDPLTIDAAQDWIVFLWNRMRTTSRWRNTKNLW